MPVILLTDRFVRTAKPQPGHRQTEYFDEATKGFSLLASAGARTFYLAYTRRADGRRMRVKLGAFPDLTLAAAVADADFVQENAPENGPLKQRVLADADRAARPGVVIASSTSGFAMKIGRAHV